MRKFNIMFGFEAEKTAEAIIRAMNSMGIAVSSVMRATKDLMTQYVEENPKLDAIILKEYLDGGGQLGTQDLIALSDKNHINVVVVLDARHRGQESMKDLYAAGILNAYFSDGKTGANADKLATLAVKGRTHKEARDYYRIDSAPANHKYMSYAEFKDLYRYLVSEQTGLNLVDRFITLSRWIDEDQLAFFIKTLPDEVKVELSAFKEFVDINNILYRRRKVDVKYPVSDKVAAGITPKEVARKLVEEAAASYAVSLPELVGVNSSLKPKDMPEEALEDIAEEAHAEEEPVEDLYSYAAKMIGVDIKEQKGDETVGEDGETEGQAADSGADDGASAGLLEIGDAPDEGEALPSPNEDIVGADDVVPSDEKAYEEQQGDDGLPGDNGLYADTGDGMEGISEETPLSVDNPAEEGSESTDEVNAVSDVSGNRYPDEQDTPINDSEDAPIEISDKELLETPLSVMEESIENMDIKDIKGEDDTESVETPIPQSVVPEQKDAVAEKETEETPVDKTSDPHAPEPEGTGNSDAKAPDVVTEPVGVPNEPASDAIDRKRVLKPVSAAKPLTPRQVVEQSLRNKALENKGKPEDHPMDGTPAGEKKPKRTRKARKPKEIPNIKGQQTIDDLIEMWAD